MTGKKIYSMEDYLNAVRELKLERAIASTDFYPNRRKALDLAILVLTEKADEFLRQELPARLNEEV